jgi:GWxTD domain-containing protein
MMKRAFVFALCAGLLYPQVGSAQEREPGTPTWVHVVSWGSVAVMGGVWAYKKFVKAPQPQKEKTYKEMAFDEISYISTPAERKALKKLVTAEEVSAYMDEFWKRRDPTPDTPENELKDEYSRRFMHADTSFGYRQRGEGWKTDMGRVYILYGPPDDIGTWPMTDFSLDVRSHAIKAVEIWVYLRPANASDRPNIFSNYFHGAIKFVFADLGGDGWYTQIYSSQEGEKVDPRVYGR